MLQKKRSQITSFLSLYYQMVMLRRKPLYIYNIYIHAIASLLLYFIKTGILSIRLFLSAQTEPHSIPAL